MRFKELRLTNYKIYYGEQVVNLDVPASQTPPYRKNLVLIGGLNGAGKTTILNAIYYVLYGKQGMTTEEYEISFTSAINDRFFGEGGREASVALTMEDRSQTIQIEVIWSFDQAKKLIRENRRMRIVDDQGNVLEDAYCTEQEFYDFINRRIPVDVAPFFIFDGEKIQQLVEKQDSKVIREAIQHIVSLEVYKSLVADLSVMQKSIEKKLHTNRSNKQVQEYVEAIKACNEKIDQYQQKLKKWTLQARQLEEKKITLGQQQRLKLAQNVSSKVQIEKRLSELDGQIKVINQQIEEFGRKSVTKILLSPLIEQLQKTLREEKAYMDRKTQAQTKFAPFETFIHRLLEAEYTPALVAEQKRQIIESGRKAWADVNHIRETAIEERDILHDISPGDRSRLLALSSRVNFNIKEMLDKKYSLETRRRVEEQNLRDAPDPVDTSVEDAELDKITRELVEASMRVRQYKTSLRKVEEEKQNMVNEYTRLQKSKEQGQQLEKEYQYILNMKAAAAEFVEEITTYKANKLKYEFESILGKLVRKDQDFEDVVFDQKNFVIRIYNDRGSEIRLKDRSAGEKQIIALAFIWALTKTAGVDLPFVIDTPLGRLDSIHRSHIIHHYFNALSDQVIILSTDTEVNADYIDFVNRYTAQAYQLVYDHERKATEIKEGYFTFQ